MTDDKTPSALKKLGSRETPAKKKFLEIIRDATTPLAAMEIQNKLKTNKTTVYRLIALFLSLEIIAEVDLGDGVRRYERKDSQHHHHLICIRCKSINDYPVEDNISKIEKTISQETHFTVIRHSLEFFGICKSCT